MASARTFLMFVASLALAYFGHNGYPAAWTVWKILMWIAIVITTLLLFIPTRALKDSDVRVEPMFNALKIITMGGLLIWVGADPFWPVAYVVCTALLYQKSKDIVNYREGIR